MTVSDCTGSRVLWTEARVDQLKELWNSGLSAAQVARQMGGVTRNGVVSKVHRMGLPTRLKDVRQARMGSPHERLVTVPRVQRAPSLPTVIAIVEEPLRLADGSHVTVLTISDRMCRWPIGDPESADFHFCGHAPKFDRPYCPGHCAIAYNAAATKSSRTRAETENQRSQLMARTGLG